MEMESNKTNVTSIRVINDRNCANRLDSETLLEVTIGTTKIWSYQTSWQRLNYHRERFRKLTFRALALRQSDNWGQLGTTGKINAAFFTVGKFP